MVNCNEFVRSRLDQSKRGAKSWLSLSDLAGFTPTARGVMA